jgi:hypothetical protein
MDRVCVCDYVHCKYESHACVTDEMWRDHDHMVNNVRTFYDSGADVTAYSPEEITGMGVGDQHGTETATDSHSGSGQCDRSDSLRVYHNQNSVNVDDGVGHHCKLTDGGRTQLHGQSPVDTNGFTATGVAECSCRCNSLFLSTASYNPKSFDLFDHVISAPDTLVTSPEAPTPEPTSFPTQYPTPYPTPACVPGTYGTPDGSDGASHCEHCPHGTISTTYNQAACVACDNGQYAIAPATGCSDCEAGQFHATSGSACTSCSGGEFAQAVKATSCVGCPSGQYQDGGDYATCDTCLGFSLTNSAQGPSQWTEGADGRTECVDKPVDCFGDYFGTATMQACGCNDDTSCRDCAGTPNGSAVLSGCDNTCESTKTLDCAGTCGGTEVLSGCDNTCSSTKALDCAGTCGGTAVLSGCDNTCGSTLVDEGCGCGVTCPVGNCWDNLSCPVGWQLINGGKTCKLDLTALGSGVQYCDLTRTCGAGPSLFSGGIFGACP